MSEILEFINNTSGQRLFLCAIVLCICTYISVQGLVYIFHSIFQRNSHYRSNNEDGEDI